MIKKNKNLFGTNTENIYIDKLSVTNKKTQRENYINQIKDYYNKINKNIIQNTLFYKNLSFKMIIAIKNKKHLFNSSSSSSFGADGKGLQLVLYSIAVGK